MPIDHRQCSFALGPAGRRRGIRLHHKAVAVLDQRVSHEAEFGFAALDLLSNLLHAADGSGVPKRDNDRITGV